MSKNNTDDRADPNSKTLGQPIACQLDIVPIFPVRFSMKSETLNEAAKTGTAPPMPTGINDPQYDLRRLRQGYLYILARVKHVGNATDEKKRWLIFEYTVANDDSNAPKLNKSGGSPYRFTQYVWADGTARGEWKKLPQSFPYAYVHSQVSAIECAYSEVRWAPEMFEELEREPTKRDKIMQKFSLTGSSDNFVLPGTKLYEKVADFKREKQVWDLVDSVRRLTGLGYNEYHKVFDSCSEKKARIIALFDRIGDIKDVSAYHQRILANAQKEFAKLLYPVTTAKAIEQIEQHVYKNPNWFKRLMSSDPLDEGMRKQIKIYAEKSPLISEHTMQNLATAQFNLLNQAGNGTPRDQMSFLDELCKANQKQLDRLASVADYAMAFYGSAMAGFGDTPKGMEYQKNLLIEGKSNSWSNSLSNLLTVGDKLNQITKEKAAKLAIKSLRFEIMIESVMTAQMLLWKEGIKEAIPYSRFLAAAGLKLHTISVAHVGSVNVGAEIVNKQMRTLIQNADELFKGLSAAHYQAELTQGVRLGTSHSINMNVHVVVKNDYNPAVRLVKVSESVGTFFAGGTLMLNLREWATYKKDNSGSWQAWFLHPAFRLANDFASLVASLDRTKGFGAKALGTFYKRLDRASVKQIQGLAEFKEPIGIEAKAGRGTQLTKHLTLQNVGRLANVLGVVIAFAQAHQAIRTGNTAARNSAIMAGMAEVSFFISTFAYTGAFMGIGVVLAIGAVLTSLVADNEFEQWVRTGFWGNSGEYWGGVRPNISRQFELAEKLSSNETSDDMKKLKTFFEQEMDGFYNLIWGIGIDTTLANQYQLRVYCPAFKDKSSIAKLTVEINIEDYDSTYLTIGSGMPVSVRVPTDKVRKQFLSQGEILIDMTQINSLRRYRYTKDTKTSHSLNTLTVTVKYPKLGEDISTFWGKYFSDYFESQITYVGVK
ncbi:hypothetical protein BKG93_01685 [Rodentibacter ratti]|uniref:Toxin VasX N-terminal region domain-containing protein n=1 Tax=Rodentibacter ratti TaxID=1906745 RepID=A0A1V3LB20_9PAST|nr:toxin VasX [Rodentibacter ratti]OOF87106.1 hypothetical protein BKG93_01685 [Rodentibacter ratti]